MFLSAIDGVRFSAKSLPLAAVPGCPTLDDGQQDSLAAPFAMLEIVDVSPNAQLDYLSSVREYKVPLLESYGYRLAGIYEVLFSNTRTAVLWTLDLDAQISLMQARDTARGLGDPGPIDGRILDWDKIAATFQRGEANELYLAGFPGPPLSGLPDDRPDSA